MYQPNKKCYIKQDNNCKIHALIVQNKKNTHYILHSRYLFTLYFVIILLL